MIICLTPNPAIDRTIILPDLVLGNVHRAEQIIIAAGGKGLNVARAIRNLGGESLSMGFAGGSTGRLLTELAQKDGLNSSWTWTDVETRTCTILAPHDRDATVINEPGMPVLISDWKRLQSDIAGHLISTKFICICGSFPPDSSLNDWQNLIAMLIDNEKQVWVDTSGSILNDMLNIHGINIKVNSDEISKSLGIEVKDIASAKQALILLAERGVNTSVITLGANGALLANEAGRWHVQGPRVKVVSTVGSGDSFLGGLVNALDQDKDWPEALGDAAAAGTANALSAGGGRFTIQEFKNIRDQLQIQAW